MAKRQKQPNSTVSGARTHYEGAGYYIPHGYTLEQVNKIFSEWQLKLQKSGHVDIESFSDCLPGLSSPFLRGTKNFKSFEYQHDPSEAISYVQTYINYYMNSRAARHKYGKSYTNCLFLLNCYIEQAEYRDISALAVSGDLKAFSKLYPNIEYPNAFKPLTLYKSHYWAYNKIRRILNHCWLWHVTSPQGELRPKDLEIFGLLGLDCKGTHEYYNSILNPLGLSVNLKHKESKY